MKQPIIRSQMPFVHGASMVPDYSNATNLAIGIAQQLEATKVAEAKQEAMNTIQTQLEGKNLQTLLTDPKAGQLLVDMFRVDPDMTEAFVDILKTGNDALIAQAERDATDAQNFYKSLQVGVAEHGEEWAKDTIRQEMAQRQNEGVDTTPLQKMLQMGGDEIGAFAMRQEVLAGGLLEATKESKNVLFNKVDPKDVTPESFAAASVSGDPADIVFKPEEPKEQPERQTIKGDDGFIYWKDNLTRVFPNAKKPVDESAMFDAAQKLRQEFRNETKEFVEVNNAYGRVIASAEDPSPAGDLALIFNFMKVLDPGSTVREGEQASARNAGGVPQRIRALYNSVVDGTKLSAKQRQDFVTRSGKLYKQSKNINDARVKEYERLARKQKLDPELVITDRAIFNVDDIENANQQALINVGKEESIEDLINKYSD